MLSNHTTTRVVSVMMVMALGAGISAVQAKTKIRVFLHCGQSNNVGVVNRASDLPDSLKKPQPNIKLLGLCCDGGFSKVGFPESVGGCGTPIDKYVVTGYGWQPLRPNWFSSGCSDCQVGPAISFGHDMQLGLPGDSLAIIVAGAAPSSLAENWLPPSKGGPGPVYMGVVAGVRDAIVNLKLTYDVEIAGMCWMQGESDAGEQEMANAYKANLTALISDFRKEFSKDGLSSPTMPFVISMISDWSGWALNSVVRKAEIDVAASVPNVGIFDTKGFTSNAVFNTTGGHYDALGAVKVGKGDAVEMLKLLRATSAASNPPRRARSPVALTQRGLTVDRSFAVVVSDIRGRTVRSVSLDRTRAVDLTPEATGAYFVTVTNRDGMNPRWDKSALLVVREFR